MATRMNWGREGPVKVLVKKEVIHKKKLNEKKDEKKSCFDLVKKKLSGRNLLEIQSLSVWEPIESTRENR